MAVAPARTRPLIAVLSRVPLFVEALRASFDGIADVQSVSADDLEAHGLVRAFNPNAVIVEGAEAELIDPGVPCVSVDLEARHVGLRRGEEWLRTDAEVSPEAIRNLIVAELYGGESA